MLIESDVRNNMYMTQIFGVRVSLDSSFSIDVPRIFPEYARFQLYYVGVFCWHRRISDGLRCCLLMLLMKIWVRR